MDLTSHIEEDHLPRIKPGDIFETSVLASVAYLQFIRVHEHFGDVVRVFSTLHDERVIEIESIPVDPSFRLFYPVKEALKQPSLVKLVGRLALRDEDQRPLILLNGNSEGPWQIYEEGKPTRHVRLLSEADAKLPRWFPIVSHSFLLHAILEANGISVPESALSVAEGDQLADDETQFFLYFDKKFDAVAAVAHLSTSDLFRKLRVKLERGASRWELTLVGRVDGVYESTVSSLEALAAEFNGVFDGFEAPIPLRVRGGANA